MILNLLCEGLGIEQGHFEGNLSKTQLFSVNHHIPCPDLSMTLGHFEHCDGNLITTLHQCDVPGLQALKDDQWIGVQPIPHAFVIMLGVQFKVHYSNFTFKLVSIRLLAWLFRNICCWHRLFSIFTILLECFQLFVKNFLQFFF
ncbi:hypothetical protein ACSBR2_020270 [Camellia fascicularis]